MAGERLTSSTHTADQVEDWLRFPNSWRLMESVKQDAEIKTTLQDAAEKIFSGYTQEELSDSQKKSQTNRAGDSVHRIMEYINTGDNAQGNGILFFSPGIPPFSLSQDEHYKLETAGENDIVRSTLLYVVIYRLAILNFLGFTLNEDNQITGNAAYRGIWKNREGAEFNLSEHRSPRRSHVLLQIYKPKVQTHRFSILEKLVVSPF